MTLVRLLLVRKWRMRMRLRLLLWILRLVILWVRLGVLRLVRVLVSVLMLISKLRVILRRVLIPREQRWMRRVGRLGTMTGIRGVPVALWVRRRSVTIQKVLKGRCRRRLLVISRTSRV